MLADGFLVDLMPFVAPILAIPDVLAIYRIHGENHFYADDRRALIEIKKKKLEMRRVLVDAMHKWLADNGYTKRQLPVRIFFSSWDLFLQSEGFLIEPPSRLSFFWWRVRRNHADRPGQTWRFTLFNYLTASLALIFGYKKADSVDEWQARTLKTTKRIYWKLSGR